MLYKILTFHISLILNTWLAQGELTVNCRDALTRNMTPHQLLRQDIFCSYDKEIRPVRDFHKDIKVVLKPFLHFFSFNENRNVLDMHARMGMSWIDENLQWDPAMYSYVNALNVKSYEIWQPDITIYNRGNLDTNRVWDFTHCIIKFTGQVFCSPHIKWSAQCIANLKLWPFDQHKCNMRIGSWTHTGEKMDVGLWDAGIRLEYYTNNTEWELLNSSATKIISRYDCCPNSTYHSINFHFHIKRHDDAYTATIIFPSLALALLTLASYCLDLRSTNRISFCCISTIGHCLYLQYLGQKLPINGTETPIILKLYCNSLVITGMAFFLTAVLRGLSSSIFNDSVTSIRIPKWLDQVAGSVLDQKVVQFLLHGKFQSKFKGGVHLAENGQQSDKGKESQWVMLITLFDRLGFIISVIVYIILYIALIPTY